MLERINLILKSRNLNAAQFADEIGVQRSSVSHILTGRNNASLDFLLKVLQRYPEIDTDWLLTGKGKMMRSAAENVGNRIDMIKKETVIEVMPPVTREITGDLFKQSVEFKKQTDIEATEEPKSAPEVIIPNSLQSVPPTETKKPDEKVDKTSSARYVEKIVIFYSDKTFVDYKPEN